VPIFLLDGTLVANGTADLFSGSIQAAIVLTELGDLSYSGVWAGTQGDGTQYGGVWPLGSGLPGYGVSYIADSRWVEYSRDGAAELKPFYGISDVLYADTVPEPGTAALMLLAVALLGYCSRRQRNHID
jgi:hypothetical protein